MKLETTAGVKTNGNSFPVRANEQIDTFRQSAQCKGRLGYLSTHAPVCQCDTFGLIHSKKPTVIKFRAKTKLLTILKIYKTLKE